MRHRKSGRKLKRTASHRRATLGALSTSLLRHKRITTTIARGERDPAAGGEADHARPERGGGRRMPRPRPIHARRVVGRLIHDQDVVKELFTTIAEKVGIAVRAGIRGSSASASVRATAPRWR